MLIIGAGGHAKELLEVLQEDGDTTGLAFFDNLTVEASPTFHGFPLLRSTEEACRWLQERPDFVVAVGAPVDRRRLVSEFVELGGRWQSVASHQARIGHHGVRLERGVMIMPDVRIYPDTLVGTGVLLNTGATVHHDVAVGEFAEISPGARLLGGSQIGAECRIGANAVVLPRVSVGAGVCVGAGAVVTKDIPAHGGTWIGVPARQCL